MPPTPYAPTALLRGVRLVPVGRREGATPSPAEPTNVRIADGVVQQLGADVTGEPGDLVVEGEGRWAIPGLWDAHVHLGQWSQASGRLDVGGTARPGEVAELVGRHLRGLPDPGRGEVVIGVGYRSATWGEPATVALLDAVSGDVPVVLISGDAHNGWLNSAALALLGVSDRAGVLEEDEWFGVFARVADLPQVRQGAEDAYRTVTQAAAARGLVGVVDFEFEAGFRQWPERFARGVDRLRVRTASYPEGLAAVLDAGLRTGQELSDTAGLLTMGPLKVISDGSLNTRTASCCEPYADAPDPAHAHGRQIVPLDELETLLARGRRGGLSAAVHAIGDAAVATALDAYARSGASGTIEHAQLIGPDVPGRMAELGIVASVQPAHLLDDRDVTDRCWPDRSDRCFALKSLLRAGVGLALGSDAPVSPLDPWLAMAAAVHRSGDDREPWNPAEALTPAEALAASTDGQPTLAVGSRGDVALLDADPLMPEADSAAAGHRLRQTTVAATLVAGRVTHLAL